MCRFLGLVAVSLAATVHADLNFLAVGDWYARPGVPQPQRIGGGLQSSLVTSSGAQNISLSALVTLAFIACCDELRGLRILKQRPPRRFAVALVA